MVNVISTEAQMVRDLELVFQNTSKDTKTMHDVNNYKLLISSSTNNEKCFAIYGTLYVKFYTNNKGKRYYKFYHEVTLHDFTMSQSFIIDKKKQIGPSKELTINDWDYIGTNTWSKLTQRVKEEMEKLSK